MQNYNKLSYPEGFYVKDFFPKEISSVQYPTLQDACSRIKQTCLPNIHGEIPYLDNILFYDVIVLRLRQISTIMRWRR